MTNPTITPAAVEAVDLEKRDSNNRSLGICSDFPKGFHVQTAINSAVEQARKDERYKALTEAAEYIRTHTFRTGLSVQEAEKVSEIILSLRDQPNKERIGEV